MTENEKMIKYSLQISMLKTLLRKKLISDEEHDRILKKIRRDFGIVSDVNTS